MYIKEKHIFYKVPKNKVNNIIELYFFIESK